jgi:hypothetical protein
MCSSDTSIRRYRDGSIDLSHYHAKASRLRDDALRGFVMRGLRVLGQGWLVLVGGVALERPMLLGRITGCTLVGADQEPAP